MSQPPSPSTLRLARGTALLLSSLSSGVVFSLSAFLVPRLLESPTPTMLTQWSRTYALGAATMPLAAAVSAASYLFLGLRGAGAGVVGQKSARLYLAAGALTVGIVPYTILFMKGTNGKLKEKEALVNAAGAGKGVVAAEEERSAKALVDWWGVLNLGRAGLLVAGTVCGLIATL